MPEDNSIHSDPPMNLDAVRDELGRIPVMGAESDQDLFANLPAGWLAAPNTSEAPKPPERELHSNAFTFGA